MRLNAVSIKEFKNIKDLNFTLSKDANFTIISGGDKSSLLQAMALSIGQSSGNFRTPDKFNFSGWDHNYNDAMEASFSGNITSEEFQASKEGMQAFVTASKTTDFKGFDKEILDWNIFYLNGRPSVSPQISFPVIRTRTHLAKMASGNETIIKQLLGIPGILWFDNTRSYKLRKIIEVISYWRRSARDPQTDTNFAVDFVALFTELYIRPFSGYFELSIDGIALQNTADHEKKSLFALSSSEADEFVLFWHFIKLRADGCIIIIDDVDLFISHPRLFTLFEAWANICPNSHFIMTSRTNPLVDKGNEEFVKVPTEVISLSDGNDCINTTLLKPKKK